MNMKFVLLLACAVAFAQTAPPRTPAKKAAAPKSVAPAPAAAPTKWPVQSIVVEGNRIFTREQVLAVAGLKIGQLAGKPEFDAAHDRLVASGAFDRVDYKFEPGPDKLGFVATFQVTETVPTFPVQFDDLGVPAKEIEGVLAAKDPLRCAGEGD